MYIACFNFHSFISYRLVSIVSRPPFSHARTNERTNGTKTCGIVVSAVVPSLQLSSAARHAFPCFENVIVFIHVHVYTALFASCLVLFRWRERERKKEDSLFGGGVNRGFLVAVCCCLALACVAGLGCVAAARGVHAFEGWGALAWWSGIGFMCVWVRGKLTLALLDLRHRCDVVLGVLESRLWLG